MQNFGHLRPFRAPQRTTPAGFPVPFTAFATAPAPCDVRENDAGGGAAAVVAANPHRTFITLQVRSSPGCGRFCPSFPTGTAASYRLGWDGESRSSAMTVQQRRGDAVTSQFDVWDFAAKYFPNAYAPVGGIFSPSRARGPQSRSGTATERLSWRLSLRGALCASLLAFGLIWSGAAMAQTPSPIGGGTLSCAGSNCTIVGGLSNGARMTFDPRNHAWHRGC